MKRRQFLKNSAAAGIVTVLTPSGFLYSCRSNSADSAENSFLSPPASAKPYTWWHWINGNVTKEGITLDLEAMAEVSVGGFQAFSAYMDIPAGPADYLSPLWIELMQHAAKEALRLGLEFDMHNCMGWSSSGGSWITPELSMQQMVWSEAFIEGGKPVNIKLKQPFKRLDFYQDTFVLAYPSVGSENASNLEQAKKITLNGNPIISDEISGMDLSSGIDAISTNSSKPSYLLFEFEKDVEVRSVSVNTGEIRIPNNKSSRNFGDKIVLEASNNGIEFEVVAELSELSNKEDMPSIAGFSVVKAKYYRLMIPMARKILNVSLSACESVNDWLYKSNFPAIGRNYPKIELNSSIADGAISESAIDPESVIDITAYMNERGELNWDAPQGHWTILRFGHTTTGATNHPAVGNGLGLECDKYNSDAFDFHFNYILEHLMPALAPLTIDGKLGMLVDSYEVGLQNWTKNMPQEFTNKRAYDLVKYLPVLTGKVVGNTNISERFLWDFRRTCADLMGDNYQGRFVELCKKNNIISYTEPYNRAPFEQMQAGAKMDINMGEFWLKTPHFLHSLKLASSIQNMNGRQIIGAESFTGRPQYSKWQEYPFSMKTQGDFMFTHGLNRMIFHRYAHQPHPTAVPGMTMGQWGFYFDRTNTWFFQGKKWLEYITRCQFLLQQGVFVGDIMCYTGHEAPGYDVSMGELLPDVPYGYDFQYANKDIFMNRISIRNGKIVLPDGMSFSLMVMPKKNHMTIEAIRKLKDFVNQGMVIVGSKPDTIPTLSNFTKDIGEFDQIADEIWGSEFSDTIDRKFGLGRVFSGIPIKEVLAKLQIKPDFEFTSASEDSHINYIHRKLENGHAYFVANRRRFAENIVCTFRIKGYEPELWDANTGEVIPIKIYEPNGGTTRVPIHLAAGGSLFVIFKSPATKSRLFSIAQNGKIILSTKNITSGGEKYDTQIANNFTVSLWVKPETDELLPTKLGAFTETTRYTSCYPIYPVPGRQMFGEGHASLSLLVARNGVVVFEKEDENPVAVLIAPMPLSGWTHFAIVYKKGVPELFVNGELITSGVKTEKLVHPVIGETYKNDNFFCYDGDLTPPKVLAQTLSASDIKVLYEKGMHLPADSTSIEPFPGKTPALLYWRNGKYTLEYSSGNTKELAIKGITEPMKLNGYWTVKFPDGLGAPKQIELPELTSLHTHTDDGVKYFSGTATYQKNFNVEGSLIAKDKRVFLDLGRVAVIAEVILNGQNLGIVWKPPYRLDIIDVVVAGENELQVKVTNQWPNRLIGDEQLPVENKYKKFASNGAGILELPDWYLQGKPKPAGGRVTFATWQFFEKESPLLESGLIGPVVIRNAVVKPVLIQNLD